MKSIKPGRAPSAMGVWGSIVAVVFGIFWTITAASMGAPGIFPIFGALFVISGVISGVYNYKNATSKQRYSSFDITEEGEEPDPLEQRFGGSHDDTHGGAAGGASEFCPYCGARAEESYEFCRKCGKRLPQ